MKFWKHTFPFLLLNMFVSAAAIFAVLYFWDRAHPLPQSPTALTQPTTGSLAASPTTIPTLRPGSTPGVSISIEGVFGAGDIMSEYVLIRNQSDAGINLSGWRLSGDGQQAFSFPNLTLNRNGAIHLYSRNGKNSVIELYWGSDTALWKPGEKLSLVDSNNITQATYTVP